MGLSELCGRFSHTRGEAIGSLGREPCLRHERQPKCDRKPYSAAPMGESDQARCCRPLHRRARSSGAVVCEGGGNGDCCLCAQPHRSHSGLHPRPWLIRRVDRPANRYVLRDQDDPRSAYGGIPRGGAEAIRARSEPSGGSGDHRSLDRSRSIPPLGVLADTSSIRGIIGITAAPQALTRGPTRSLHRRGRGGWAGRRG
jgi:hypothetical protein